MTHKGTNYYHINASETIDEYGSSEIYGKPAFESQRQAYTYLQSKLPALKNAFETNDNEAIIKAAATIGGITQKILVSFCDYEQHLNTIFPKEETET